MTLPSFEQFLSVKNAIFPTFADNGNYLLFLSDISGTYQIWLQDLRQPDARPRPLTESENRVTSLQPNPTATAFIFTQDYGGDENDQLYLLELDFGQDGQPAPRISTLFENPKVKTNFGAWQPSGQAYCFSSNQRHPAFYDIYIQEKDPAGVWQTPRLVYQADDNFFADDWSPDGRYLLLRRSNANLDNDLFLLDLQAESEALRHLTPHTGLAKFEHNCFSPDGEYIYTTTDRDFEFSVPALIEIATGEVSALQTPHYDYDSLSLSPDGEKLVYQQNYAGYDRLFIRDLETSAETEVVGLPHGVTLGIGLRDSPLRWSPDSQQVAFSFHSPTHNADIWLYDLPSQSLRQVTHSDRAKLDFSQLVAPQTVGYPTFDAREIPALLYLPVGTPENARLPFIVLVHGGPESQTRYGWNPVIQYYVNRGYGVLAPNVRGSSGYGKSYLALDDVQKRMDSVADLAAAVEWLTQKGYADAKKIAVYGQSYGGFMVLAAITTYPDLWAAGVDIYGIANMLTFLEKTSSYRLKMRTPEYGDPVADRDFLIEISPIHKIDQIKAPLMVIHGARDPRVPLYESEQMVEALRQRQHPVEFIFFDDEGHGITKLRNKLKAFPAAAAFLDKYLKGQ